MKIIVARNAGFCFGVRRAIDAVYENLNQKENIYTLGPIIHNPSVVEMLEKKGVKVAEKIDDISEGTVVIRSHGVGKSIYDKITNKKLEYIDATCPYVKRIHKLVERYYREGYQIIVVGEKSHPEVIGINGWCNETAYIINNIEEAKNLPEIEKACLVAQTTITNKKWNEVLDEVKNKVKQLEVFNTICSTTAERQQEAESIAKSADVMWVVGGKNSSNTMKLYSICKTHCPRTFLIETAKDIDANVISPQDVVGITAGASTPDWIIKEVVEKMNEIEQKFQETVNEKQDEKDLVNEAKATQEKLEASMEDFEDTMVRLRAGQRVKGTVLSLNDAEVIVNIGYKSDGILPVEEVILEEGQSLSDLFKPGDEIEVKVVKVNDGEGNVILSRKSLEMELKWKELEEGFKSGKEFEGACTEAVKGGVIAKINGIRAFVPASHLATHYVEDLNTFVGNTLRLRIIELDRRRRRVVASQKVILEEEEQKRREELWNSIEEGQKITGVVKRITDFGAFVDIGGVDGLVHISDLSWGHVGHPSEVLKEGETVEVVVLNVDRERERISLGYKQTLPHPWENVEQKYPVGSVVKGKVVRITSFGAFVELEPGVDGLLHISQISDKRINKVADVLQVGDEVEAKVLESDSQRQRIGLSIRELLIDREKEENKKIVQKAQQTNESEPEPDEMTVPLAEFFPDELKQMSKSENHE